MFSESAIDYCDDVNKTTAYIRLILPIPTYLVIIIENMKKLRSIKMAITFDGLKKDGKVGATIIYFHSLNHIHFLTSP